MFLTVTFQNFYRMERRRLWDDNCSLYSQYVFLYIYTNAKTYRRTQKQIIERKNKQSMRL